MTSPLRITIVTPRFLPDRGGLETHVAEIARRLAADGMTVRIVTQTGSGAPATDEWEGVEIRRFGFPFGRFGELPARGFFTELNALCADADVVQVHSYHALPALVASLRLPAGTPLVVTPHYHGTGHTRLRAAVHHGYRFAGRRMFARANAVVAVSDAEARLLAAHFDTAVAGKIAVIPNGIDAVAVGEPFARPRRTVLTTARLEPYKQVDLLIRAVARLQPDVELVVVGDGPARPALADLAQELGVADRVVLTGRVSDAELARWRATAAVYATASRHEAFGLTLGEALVTGSPVVASDIPAHREVMELSGVAADRCRLAAHGSGEGDVAGAYAQALAASLTGDRMATPARGQLPTWDTVAANTLDLYRSLGLKNASVSAEKSFVAGCALSPPIDQMV